MHKVSGEVLKPPVAIPWYPGKLAWQLDANRAQLRKIAALARLHDFMKRENEAGAITRQEAVSMIPPLLLDVQPHHMVHLKPFGCLQSHNCTMRAEPRQPFS